MDVQLFVDGNYSLEVGRAGWLRRGGENVQQVRDGWRVTPSMLEAFPDRFVTLSDAEVDPAPEGVTQVGWRAVPDGDGYALERALEDAPVPDISPRQLFLALVQMDFISPAEAIAAARTGEMPASVEAVVAQLPEPAQVEARITWASMKDVYRNDPLVPLLAATQGHTSEQTDAFFRAAARL